MTPEERQAAIQILNWAASFRRDPANASRMLFCPRYEIRNRSGRLVCTTREPFAVKAFKRGPYYVEEVE